MKAIGRAAQHEGRQRWFERRTISRLAWPTAIFAASVIAYALRDTYAPAWLAQPDRVLARNLLMAGVWYSAALLLARAIGLAIEQKNNGRRRVPKLLGELIAAAGFVAATVGTIAMWLGQSAGSALASSGLIIAVLGFAIRNILADVLGGIALGVEAPFRIGDWVEIDGEVRGRVTEIGWRTTRIQTRNDIYMILPNSDIARKRMTNYSAPRKHYRSKLEITIGQEVDVHTAKELLLKAAVDANIQNVHGKAPDVRAVSYAADGVKYMVRYWVPSFVDESDCRDLMITAIDKAIRGSGVQWKNSGKMVTGGTPDFRVTRDSSLGHAGYQRTGTDPAAGHGITSSREPVN